MPALSVSCQITKRQIQSVDFVRAFALSGPPDGSLRERLRFNSNSVAESRFEIAAQKANPRAGIEISDHKHITLPPFNARARV